jgi:hypothetical protein
MAILGKTPLAISPAAALSVLPAKRPPSMTQTPADPATASTSDTVSEPAAAATVTTQVLPPVAAPARELRKTVSSDSVLDEGKTPDGGDTPSSTTSSNTPQRQRKYERKTKRFIWPDELHRLFVAAIFDGECFLWSVDSPRQIVSDLVIRPHRKHAVGLKHASPKALLTVS